MAHAQTQDLFVSNQSNGGSISRFAGTGPGTFGTTATTFSTGLDTPYALAFDAQGDLFVSQQFGNSITEFASTGAGTFGTDTTVETGLSFPEGLAFSPLAPPAVPEASTTVSLGLLLMLGAGGAVRAARRKRAA